MFAWPTLELTKYEEKFVRYYKQPKLDSQGNITNETWPGVLKRVYTTELFNRPDVNISRYANGPVFESRVLISRRARVFGFTFTGDTSAWYLEIETASGEKYTNAPCLVSSMCAGTNYDAESSLGSPALGALTNLGIFELIFQQDENFGIMVEPNYQLLPNEALIFRGRPAPIFETLEPVDVPFLQLSIGIHAWEFPGMGYSKVSDGRNV
jgi:hypothetical protein